MGARNAAWHSRNLPEGKRLLVRIHAQEIRGGAKAFGREIDASAVERFIFVSDAIRQKALDLWKWPAQKTMVIPNFVLENSEAECIRPRSGSIHLGLLGMVPQLKRFDRALDLLKSLHTKGVDAFLHIKGHRPEDIEFDEISQAC